MLQAGGIVWSSFEIAITEHSEDGAAPRQSGESIKTRPDGSLLTWFSHNSGGEFILGYHEGKVFGPDHEIWSHLSAGNCISVFGTVEHIGKCDGRLGELRLKKKLV